MRCITTPALVVGSVLLAGCFGGDGGRQAASGGKPAGGGTLIVKAAYGIATLDPGMTAGDDGSTAVTVMHRPLYWFFPGDVRPAPDVADGPPQVADEGRSVTVRLRRGVRYDRPVSREVRSDDVKYAIERLFTKAVPNGYASRAFGDLVGVDAFAAGRAEGITGIETPDARTLVFRLRRGSGANFAAALATYGTAPVPREYARRYDRSTPSTYGDHAPATGPYRVARHDRGRLLVLARNPAWDPKTDPRPAHVDRIEFQVGGDPEVLSDQIARGRGMISGVFPVAPRVLRRLEREAPDRVATLPSSAITLLALNTRRPLLRRLEVRRAIAAALDRAFIANALGSRYAKVATHFLPPAMPGFREAGGFSATERFLAAPEGDPELARRYLRGVAPAELGRRMTLLVPNSPLAMRQAAGELAADLRAVGLHVDLRLLSPEGLLSNCTVPAKKVDMCVSGVFAPPGQPGFVLELLFHGRGISPQANFNVSQLDDPEVNAALDAAALEVDPQRRASAYGAVDRRIVATAAAVPLAWPTQPGIRSADVMGRIAPGGWDPAFLAVS